MRLLGVKGEFDNNKVKHIIFGNISRYNSIDNKMQQEQGIADDVESELLEIEAEIDSVEVDNLEEEIDQIEAEIEAQSN